MKYGMNLLLWTGELNDGLLPILDKLKKMGFDGVELPMFNLDLDYAAWGKRLNDAGLARTAVTVRNVTDNPISSDAAVRAKGVELNKKTLDCCAAVGAETLVGPYHSALGHFSVQVAQPMNGPGAWRACELWLSMLRKLVSCWVSKRSIDSNATS